MAKASSVIVLAKDTNRKQRRGLSQSFSYV